MILEQSKLGAFIAETFRQVALSRANALTDGVVQEIDVEIDFSVALVADDGINAITRRQVSTPSNQVTIAEEGPAVTTRTQRPTESTVEQAPSTVTDTSSGTRDQRQGGGNTTDTTNTYEPR